jgi:hypothetical protein
MGAGAAGWILSPGGVMAGPFDRSEFEKMIPPDKRLAPGWVKSLYARGKREVYGGPGRKAELARIGMPIGGICAGQVYLGGDGRLWRWNVMNAYRKTSDGSYKEPPEPDYPFEQGFAIRVRSGDTVRVRALDRRGFDNITFCVDTRALAPAETDEPDIVFEDIEDGDLDG